MSANPQPTHNAGMRINRREFLYYLGGASLAMFSAGTCAVVYQIAQAPLDFRIQPGVFELDPDILKSSPPPVAFSEAQAWLVLGKTGLYALYAECQHRRNLPCQPKWVDINNRFECPCHGSKFQLDGSYISGPASRGMDRLTIWVETPHSIFQTPQDGSPVPITDTTRIWIDRTRIIHGQPRE